MTEQKILVVEDEEDIRDLIHFHLFKSKYKVLEAENGQDAIDIALSHKPDLVLLDIMLPSINGLDVCKKLKSSPDSKEIKIIFITSKGEEEDIVKGLELGADDYITKPFSPKILMARVKTVLKRDQKEGLNLISSRGIVLNDSKRKVHVDEKEIIFTETEYQLLKHFISSPGHVFTRCQIVNTIKGQNHAVTDRSGDTQLVSLRKKMGVKGKLIETVWGIGYRFKENEA
jgi:two-component system, OmpR family, alkaline phosphatase synthesis response regulator PhoP